MITRMTKRLWCPEQSSHNRLNDTPYRLGSGLETFADRTTHFAKGTFDLLASGIAVALGRGEDAAYRLDALVLAKVLWRMENEKDTPSTFLLGSFLSPFFGRFLSSFLGRLLRLFCFLSLRLFSVRFFLWLIHH
jgi:hypothetical protein